MGVISHKLDDIEMLKSTGGVAQNVNFAIKINYIDNLIDMLPDRIMLPKVNIMQGEPAEEQVKIAKNYVYLIVLKSTGSRYAPPKTARTPPQSKSSKSCDPVNGEVSYVTDVPRQNNAGDIIPIKINICKPNITGYFVMQIVLPFGYGVEEIQSAGAKFKCSGSALSPIAHWRWDDAPDKMNITFKIILLPSYANFLSEIALSNQEISVSFLYMLKEQGGKIKIP
jgi:hypothetical protein